MSISIIMYRMKFKTLLFNINFDNCILNNIISYEGKSLNQVNALY